MGCEERHNGQSPQTYGMVMTILTFKIDFFKKTELQNIKQNI